MRKFLLGSVALVALSAAGPAAYAADMPARVRAAPVPVFTWTGCYFGGYVG